MTTSANAEGIDKLVDLMKRLNISTKRGAISWDTTDRPFAFAYSTPKSSVLVLSSDDDGQVPYEMQILDERGNVIESFVSHFQRENAFGGGSTLVTRKLGGPELKDLYERVRRAALGVDEKLNDLIAGLPDISLDELVFGDVEEADEA